MNIPEVMKKALVEKFNGGATKEDYQAFLKYYSEVIWPAFCKDIAETQPMPGDWFKQFSNSDDL